MQVLYHYHIYCRTGGWWGGIWEKLMECNAGNKCKCGVARYKVEEAQRERWEEAAGRGRVRWEKERKKGEMVGWKAGGLMCPSWGEAGQKWLSVELNWLHYRSIALESISDITHPSQTASYNSQREWWEQPIRRMQQPLWFRCGYDCFACFNMQSRNM